MFHIVLNTPLNFLTDIKRNKRKNRGGGLFVVVLLDIYVLHESRSTLTGLQK